MTIIEIMELLTVEFCIPIVDGSAAGSAQLIASTKQKCSFKSIHLIKDVELFAI